jgi:hypothetical protein
MKIATSVTNPSGVETSFPRQSDQWFVRMTSRTGDGRPKVVADGKSHPRNVIVVDEANGNRPRRFSLPADAVVFLSDNLGGYLGRVLDENVIELVQTDHDGHEVKRVLPIDESYFDVPSLVEAN